MNLGQIKNMLEKFSLLNVDNVVGYENETKILARIILKIRYIFQNFKTIEGFINPKLRYGDYYNERLRYLECLEYGKICGVEVEGFMLYCLNKMLENTFLLFFSDEICSSLEEALGLIDFGRDLLDL